MGTYHSNVLYMNLFQIIHKKISILTSYKNKMILKLFLRVKDYKAFGQHKQIYYAFSSQVLSG
jgi:hypothetical protein